MPIIITDGWWWFTITFGIMLFTTFIMNLLSKNFLTHDVVERRFSIMDLEFAANSQEIMNLIKGMYLLEPAKSRKTINSLRAHLLVDFIFMPAIYTSIFLLCMMVSGKMESNTGVQFFRYMAYAQAIPWLIDVVENIYLLIKIKAYEKASSKGVHKLYQYCEYIKWGIALLGGMCSIFALFYFWLTGNFSKESLHFALIIIGEIIAFFIIGKMASKKKVTTKPGDKLTEAPSS